MRYAFDDMEFSTAYWYGGVDFYSLEERYGAECVRNVLFHMAAFDINKIGSLRPDYLDWGEHADLVTDEFESLWRQVFRNVWAQWRYENDDPDYEGPLFTGGNRPQGVGPARTGDAEVEALHFCGGGKDSLVAMKLLERGGIPFDSLVYASSIYGLSAVQFDLSEGLLRHGAPVSLHRQWIHDDFLDSPVLELNPELGMRTITAAETPSSVFGALPYALQHRYRHLVLGHERSADSGQVTWDRTQEDINHQWGKSYEAEKLLNGYVRERLVEDVSYFSILKPIYDVLIFNMLRNDLPAVPQTHSCNLSKPWCKKCPKCAYVWLNYMAWLPVDLVGGMFGNANLFDMAENQETFQQLLGLGDRLPFECIGQQDESRLAFEMCRRKGLGGAAMDAFASQRLEVPVERLLDKYLSVDPDHSTMPEAIYCRIAPQFEKGREDAISYVGEIMGG